MTDRERFFEILQNNVKNPKMIAHSLASEAVMRSLANYFGEDDEAWGLAGLMHDVDVEITAANTMSHGIVGASMLEKEGMNLCAVEAIRMHNERATGLERTKLIEHALAAGETITGLIFAVALVYPDKKISSIKVKSVTKRMKEKLFAASVKRESIMECEKIGLPLDQFVELSLNALIPIESELGF